MLVIAAIAISCCGAVTGVIVGVVRMRDSVASLDQADCDGRNDDINAIGVAAATEPSKNMVAMSTCRAEDTGAIAMIAMSIIDNGG